MIRWARDWSERANARSGAQDGANQQAPGIEADPAELAAIAAVHRAAFGQSVEGDIVAKLREAGLITVSLVAQVEGEVVGHIAFSPVELVAESGERQSANDLHFGLGPVAVHPSVQRSGLGG